MPQKQSNEAVVDAFRERLREEAAFAFVPEPMPMRIATGAVVYYLFFAGSNKTGAKIVAEIFRKHADRTS